MDTLKPNLAISQPVSFFLDNFEPLRRSGIASQFFGAVRSGALTEDEVIGSVKGDALRRTLTAEGERLETQKQLIDLLETDEARVYAAEIIMRESLSIEEKWRLKRERQQHYRREYLRAQSPTERQLSFLKSLGCQVLPASRWEASEMIDGHVSR